MLKNAFKETLLVLTMLLAEDYQEVKGVIIGLEDDLRIKRALSVISNIEFYRYQVNFKLFKAK